MSTSPFRSSAFSCPKCKLALVATDDVPDAFGCRQCGGMWLGEAAASSLEAAMNEALVDASTTLANSAAVEPGAEVGLRGCPICEQPLERTRVARVTLDICNLHGTWFDRNELRAFAAAFAIARENPRVQLRGTEPSRADAYARDARDAENAVGSVLGVLGGICTVINAINDPYKRRF